MNFSKSVKNGKKVKILALEGQIWSKLIEILLFQGQNLIKKSTFGWSMMKLVEFLVFSRQKGENLSTYEKIMDFLCFQGWKMVQILI